MFYNSSTEPAFTRSKSLPETPDECAGSVEVNNKETITKSMTLFWCPYA